MVTIPVNEHLLLRTFKNEDAPELFAVVDADRAHLRPWLSWIDATTKEEHTRAFIEEGLAMLHHQRGLATGIFLQEKIIGGIGLYQWDHQLKKASLGYWIRKEYEGKGLLSQCLKHFIDFIFTTLGLNKIEIHFIPSNKRSAAIAEKLNAKIEGVLRESYLIHGKLEDMVIAGILKREWGRNKS